MSAAGSWNAWTLPELAPIDLGAISLRTPVILAPMAGVTDRAFRRLCRQFADEGLPQGAADSARLVAAGGLFVNEMVTARALLEGNEASWHMVEPDEDDPVRSLQLYGTDPETLGLATGLLVERGLADHID